MYQKVILSLVLGLSFSLACTIAQAGDDAEALQKSVEQLRTSIGRWDVTTEFLNADGSVAKAVSGNYAFSWVIADRVVSGESEIPELKLVSAILFYVNEAKQLIEMVSVGADGKLWVMTGELGGEVRTTKEFKTASGGTGQLRFTRYNVQADSFESKMEYTEDGGESWLPGNHQVFQRAASDSQ
ncbi:MAG: hypothetical protein WBS20_01770 [Lysobacterales bacterium]